MLSRCCFLLLSAVVAVAACNSFDKGDSSQTRQTSSTDVSDAPPETPPVVSEQPLGPLPPEAHDPSAIDPSQGWHPDWFGTQSTQIADYVRRVFEDSRGHLWFGTNSRGVCRYDGESLRYFTPADGLGSTQVTGIAEDADGNVWFSTAEGVSQYDGTSIRNFTTMHGLTSNRAWCVTVDSRGMVWAGTNESASRFDGHWFLPFPLPLEPGIEPGDGIGSARRVLSIIEDRDGDIWLGAGGAGVYCYDGEDATIFTKANGLCGNFVSSILEDRDGNLWFGTRFSGVCRFDGQSFDTFGAETLRNPEIWNLYEDRSGSIWLTVKQHGVARLNGKSLHFFGKEQGLCIPCVQTIYEDRAGNLWCGGGGGLYRLDGEAFVNVTQDGPWP